MMQTNQQNIMLSKFYSNVKIQFKRCCFMKKMCRFFFINESRINLTYANILILTKI